MRPAAGAARPGTRSDGGWRSGANLSRANLTSANLTGANLSGADLLDAIVSQTQLDAACGTTVALNRNLTFDRSADQSCSFWAERH